MPWIRVIQEEEASGDLKDLYQQVISSRGKLSNILKIHSLHPSSLQNHLNLYLDLMFGKSPLSRTEREMIGVVVSAENRCPYCIRHHAEALTFFLKDEKLIQALIDQEEPEGFSEQWKILCRFSRKLTRHPDRMREKDIHELRRAGYSDQAVLDITLIVAYFNFVNRTALGLGVEYSEKESRGYRYQ